MPLACRWLKSGNARNFVGFVLALNEAVRGKRLSDDCEVSPAVEALLKVCLAHQDLAAAPSAAHVWRPERLACVWFWGVGGYPHGRHCLQDLCMNALPLRPMYHG